MRVSSFAALCTTLLSQSAVGRGNLECWSSGFNYDFCCDTGVYGPAGNTACWDSAFTYQYCCFDETKPDKLLSIHTYKTGFIGRESAVIQDRQKDLEAEESGSLSDCQFQFGWMLNVKWGAPIGNYPEYSGVPLRHIGSGWDGQRAGNYRGCLGTGGRFFLVELDFEFQSSASQMHFGLCAPEVCSVEQVANDLVPDYVMRVADTRRLMMTMGSVQVWKWPHFLDTVYVSDLQDVTLRDRIQQVSFQTQLCFAFVTLLLILATICDDEQRFEEVGGPHEVQRASLKGIRSNLTAIGHHFVHAFSAKRAWKELWSPPQGDTVDFLKGIATVLLVSLHLEMAQNESMDGAQEGGNLFRISMCFRCVIMMTVVTLHLAIGPVESASDGSAQKLDSMSLNQVFRHCSLKLGRKFLRHLPLIMLSVWWDRIGSRFSFFSQPLNYLDGTQSTVDDQVLKWTTPPGECLKSYGTCVLRFFTINWQVRDSNERVVACFGLLLLRAAGFRRVTHGILYVWAVIYYVIRESGPESRWEWEKLHHEWNYMVAKRLEYPAFLGLFLAAQNLAHALPQRLLSKRAGLLTAAASWVWSSWINQNDPAQWCLARNVKKCLGDVPFVVGLCVLLRTGLPSTELFKIKSPDKDVKENSDQSTIAVIYFTLTFISRLSFCILVAEAPFQTYLLRGTWRGGVPLMRCFRVDPMWERILLAPGLLLAHGMLALLLFMMVQRPADIFLKPLLKTRFAQGVLHGLLPLYVAFLAYHSTEM
ncbi:unnamed protein product [Effrenium voratum]|uniref:Uncharacterized protein n=1 Tax=Effrenium voratum TaxID=2562239 RepID=A0AA36JT95_9DINO|nr:unnamed protein product [Effrenium voratum]CAJ1420234.1 unnamed protein product [Effrenium voratum]